MDKEMAFKALILSIEGELNDAIAASKDAADYATNEEARAESKWDTQGLEASYLAAGQAEQARQWAQALQVLHLSRPSLLASKDLCVLGALVTCDLGGTTEHFFFAPAGGGQVLIIDNTEITVITPLSPVATRILGKRAGDRFTLANGVDGAVLEVA